MEINTQIATSAVAASARHSRDTRQLARTTQTQLWATI
jgi:hypothetical protein